MAISYVLKNKGKVIAIDPLREINRTALSPQAKQTAIRAQRKSNAVTFLFTAAGTAVTDATPATYYADANFAADLVKNRWYEVEADLLLKNSSAANGALARLIVSGTQTNATVAGGSFSTDTASNTASASVSTTVLVTGSADTTSPYRITLKVKFKLQNSGRLQLATAEKDTGSGSLTVEAGSTIIIRELQ